MWDEGGGGKKGSLTIRRLTRRAITGAPSAETRRVLIGRMRRAASRRVARGSGRQLLGVNKSR